MDHCEASEAICTYVVTKEKVTTNRTTLFKSAFYVFKECQSASQYRVFVLETFLHRIFPFCVLETKECVKGGENACPLYHSLKLYATGVITIMQDGRDPVHSHQAGHDPGHNHQDSRDPGHNHQAGHDPGHNHHDARDSGHNNQASHDPGHNHRAGYTLSGHPEFENAAEE